MMKPIINLFVEREVFLATMAVVLSVVITVVKVWWKPREIRKYFMKQGINGPEPHPLLGNMKEIGDMMMKASCQVIVPMTSHNIFPRVLPFYHLWKKIYGSPCLIWFGPTPRLAISDPFLMKEIFSTRSDCYEKYESHPLVRKLEGNGLISLKGERWAHRRKIISPVFYMENLKLMIPAMTNTVTEMLDKWSTICTQSSTGTAEINLSTWFNTLMEETITLTVFGTSYNDGKAIYELQSQQMVFAVESFQKVFIPGYKYLPNKRNRAIWRLDREIKILLTKLIAKKKNNILDHHRKSKSNHDDEKKPYSLPLPLPLPPRDLLDHLIRENVDTAEIIEECKSFFFAGKETTSNLLVWSTLLLAIHPHWQHLARQEILTICGGGGGGAGGSISSPPPPTKHHLPHLKTLTLIIYETLRLYPPVVAMIRRTKTNVNLGKKYTIPTGTELLLPIIALHHDITLWGSDVHEFNPTRFNNGGVSANGFMAFGVGQRQCIGQNLAIMQVKLVLAIILQRFRFEISPDYKHAPTVLLLVHPQYGAPVIFTKL